MNDFNLEIRQCACACGHTFACLPSSNQTYFASFHNKSQTIKQRPVGRYFGRQKKDIVDEFIHSIDDYDNIPEELE